MIGQCIVFDGLSDGRIIRIQLLLFSIQGRKTAPNMATLSRQSGVVWVLEHGDSTCS